MRVTNPRLTAAAHGETIRGTILAKMGDVPFRRAEDAATVAIKPNSLVAVPSRLDETRAALPKTFILAPDHTPSAATIGRIVSADLRRRCLEACSTSPEAIDAAVTALNAVVPPARPFLGVGVAAMIAMDKTADYAVHDAYFNIGRTGHDHPLVYLRSTLQALAGFRRDLAETPTQLDPHQRSIVDLALRTTLAIALGAEVSPPPAIDPPPAPAFADFAPRRWIRGHQIFAALTQGLIFAVEALEAARAAADETARAQAADHLILLLQASGHTLQLTGDFSGEIYEEVVRPSMALPHQPKGFSGLLSADHSHLVLRMKATRPAVDWLRDGDPSRHAGVVSALAGVYDSHKHVCARFVGAEKSSLLMKSEMGRSSVDQLDRFKSMRIRHFV